MTPADQGILAAKIDDLLARYEGRGPELTEAELSELRRLLNEQASQESTPLFKVHEVAGTFRVIAGYRTNKFYANEVLAIFAKRIYAENAAREMNAEELQDFSAEAEAAHERRQLGSFGV